MEQTAIKRTSDARCFDFITCDRREFFVCLHTFIRAASKYIGNEIYFRTIFVEIAFKRSIVIVSVVKSGIGLVEAGRLTTRRPSSLNPWSKMRALILREFK